MTAFEFTPWYEWHDSTVDDFCAVAEIMGFDVSPRDVCFSGFWSQGDGASFTGSWCYRKGMVRAVEEYAPKDAELHRIAAALALIARRNFYQVSGTVVRISSHYYHKNTVTGDLECEHWREVAVGTDDDFTECVRDLCRWLYRALEREYEYQFAVASGSFCREKMASAREIGRKYVAALRAIKTAFRERHESRRDDVPLFQTAQFIQMKAREAREAREDWRDARADAIAEINELRPGKRAWNADLRESWLDGYACAP